MVLKPPEAAQTPKTDPTSSGQIAFRYPVGDKIKKKNALKMLWEMLWDLKML